MYFLSGYNKCSVDKSFNSEPHKQTGLVIEKVEAKFKGCSLAEWIKMFVKEQHAN